MKQETQRLTAIEQAGGRARWPGVVAVESPERAVNVITEQMEPLPLAAVVSSERTHSFG